MRKRSVREPCERPKVVRVRIVSGEMALTGLRCRPEGSAVEAVRAAVESKG